MYTAGDFSRDMYQLTARHGKPLTYDEDDIWYTYFVEEAAAGDRKLPLSATIGRLATARTRRSHDIIETDVAMLNDTFRLMPDYGKGAIIGAIALSAVRTVIRKSGPVMLTPWSLDVTMHHGGEVELNALDLRVDSAEGQEALEGLGVIDLLSDRETGGYVSLDLSKNHALHEDQLRHLRSFVVSAFEQ